MGFFFSQEKMFFCTAIVINRDKLHYTFWIEKKKPTLLQLYMHCKDSHTAYTKYMQGVLNLQIQSSELGRYNVQGAKKSQEIFK